MCVATGSTNLLWIRKVGIGLSEGELKREAVETGREFVHQRRRKIMSVADCQILPKPVHFTQWWKSGVHLGPCVEEVTLLGIESILQPPDKDAVIGTKRVIHSHIVVGPFELGRRVPVESGLIESITQAESVGSRKAVHQRQHRRISADSLRVVGEHIVAVHAVAHDRRAIAHRNAGLQIAIGVYQEW